MSITRVQYVSNASTGSGTTSLTTTIAAATAGNLLLALIATGSTSSAGTTTTPSGFSLVLGPITNTSAVPAPVSLYLYYKIATGGETSVVATNTVISGVTCQVWEWSASSGWPASPVDKTASSANQAATTTPVTGTTAATTQSEELWIGSVSTNSGTQITYSLPLNSFTQETTAWAGASPFFSPNTAGLYKMVSATTTANSGVTSSISKGFGGLVATFKDNAAASGGGPLISNSVLTEPAGGAQVVTSGDLQQSNAILSEPAAQVVARGQIAQSNAALSVVAQVVTAGDALVSNSALASASAQVVASPAAQQSNTSLVQLAGGTRVVDNASPLVSNSVLSGTGGLAGVGGGALVSNSALVALAAQLMTRGGILASNAALSVTGGIVGPPSSGLSLHGSTMVRPSGEVGVSIVRTAENGVSVVRTSLHGLTTLEPSETALSDVRASLVGTTTLRGG